MRGSMLTSILKVEAHCAAVDSSLDRVSVQVTGTEVLVGAMPQVSPRNAITHGTPTGFAGCASHKPYLSGVQERPFAAGWSWAR